MATHMQASACLAVRSAQEIERDLSYKGSHHIAELAAAYTGMMGRSAARRAPRVERFDEIVAKPFVSVTGRVIHLLRGLKNGSIGRLRQLFASCASRGETVATFLALLELIRGGRVSIDKSEGLRLHERKAARR